MDNIINRYLSNVVLGQLRQFRNMGLVPLFNSLNHGPDYLTLGEASALNYLTVTEAEPNGAGPRFRLMNRLPMPVLALRGSELKRTIHMRVFAKTILLQEESETTIPAKYVEWNGANCNVNEPSGGPAEPKEYLQAFRCVPGQKGLLVTIDGKIVGMDILSREEAYEDLHLQLVKRYATVAVSGRRAYRDGEFHDKAMSFFKRVAECQERKYPYLGYGLNYQLDGVGVSGAALVIGRHVIHLSLSWQQSNSSSVSHVAMSPAVLPRNGLHPASISREVSLY